jgi:two-component system sensor histidine kinase PilS (NtrC family)
MSTAQQNLALPATLDTPAGETLPWRLLHVLNLFRMVVGGVVVTLYFSDRSPRLLGEVFPDLFLWTGILYFCFSALASFTIRAHRPGLELQTYAQLAADIAAVVLLMHSSGGVESGLGSLLFISIAVNSVLLSQRIGIAFAAIATLAILVEQTLSVLYGTGGPGGYTQTGILGVILFAAAFGGHFVGTRLRESTALAEQRGVDLANLSEINEYVIKHMRTGILVVDEKDHVRMLNSAAAASLKTSAGGTQNLGDIAPRLKSELDAWRRDIYQRPATIAAGDGRPLIPHFASVGGSRNGGALILLEDASTVAEQVRQMKLAALGRLTASIAHEIRNPLTAVSHASQLLAESPNLSNEDRRLTEIINEHTARVERMVENIMQLSRRDSIRAEELDLVGWLKDFIAEFRDRHGLSGQALLLQSEVDGELRLRADPSHLHQILWNLSENALRYGAAAGQGARIEFHVAGTQTPGGASLEILDQGPGVPADMAEHIFEPFYTSNPRGTGLGLFIARELCECNRARLSYEPRPRGGSCFRIVFGAAEGWLT